MKIKQLFLMAAIGLMATATFTSCEDILGEWDRPTPQVPTSAVEEAKVLGAAQNQTRLKRLHFLFTLEEAEGSKQNLRTNLC